MILDDRELFPKEGANVREEGHENEGGRRTWGILYNYGDTG